MRHIIQFILLISFACTNCNSLHAQWVKTNAGLINMNVSSMVVSDTNLLAGTYSSGVFLSSDNGLSWNGANSGLTKTDINALIVSGQNLFAATAGGIFISSDNGKSWSRITVGLTDTIITAITVNSKNILAGTQSGRIFLSTNNGNNWSNVGSIHDYVNALAISGQNILTGTSQHIFISTDNGVNWAAIDVAGFTTLGIHAFAILDTTIFVATSYGVYLSTNNGLDWNKAGLGLPMSLNIRALMVLGSHIFTGTDQGIFLLSNEGGTWTTVNTGLELNNRKVQVLAAKDGYLFAGVIGGGVWKRPLSEMVTSIEKENTSGLEKFTLLQNYPNPFNPSTYIEYYLPKVSNVNISVYDMLGRLVKILVDEEKSAGYYKVGFNGSDLSSGVYSYRLQVGSFTETKKLVLLK